VENYYDWLLQLCVVIPQQLDYIYLKDAFKEGLQTKGKNDYYQYVMKNFCTSVRVNNISGQGGANKKEKYDYISLRFL
jgi:squalene cyclase